MTTYDRQAAEINRLREIIVDFRAGVRAGNIALIDFHAGFADESARKEAFIKAFDDETHHLVFGDYKKKGEE